MDVFLDESVRRQDDAAEAAALTVDVLGRRIHDNVSAEREWTLPDRCREYVIDDQPCTAAMRDLGDRRNIDHIEGRIGRAFEKARLGVWAHRLLPLVEIVTIDQCGLDSIARQQIFHDVAARAEQRLGCDDVIAGFQRREDRGCDSSHAGCCGSGGFGTFEFDHALFEHRNRRI